MTEEEKAVLITGASRGLGRALVEFYASHGWKTVPLVRDPQMAERMRSELTACSPIVADVMTDDLLTDVSQGLSRIGQIDVLINNAGVPGQSTTIDSVMPDEIGTLFQTHCLGAMRCTKATIPFMQGRSRIIINITSRFGSVTRWASGAFAGRSVSYSYRIAKASQNMLTVSMAAELGPRGFIVCAVHPGRLKTQSGSSDADTEPDTAARRLAEWIESINFSMNGQCFDLENSEVMGW